MNRTLASLAVAFCLAACGARDGSLSDASPAPVVEVPPAAAFALATGEPAGLAVWPHPTDLARSLVVAAGGDAGLLLYGLDGVQREAFGQGAAAHVAVGHGFASGGVTEALIVSDGAEGLRAWRIDPATGRPQELTRSPLPLQDEATGLCLYRSTHSGRHYAFAATDGGVLQQWELSAREGVVHGRLVRTLPLGKGIGACAADDTGGLVYVADEAVGIWRIAAEPESDPGARELVESVAPRGRLGTEVKGIALQRDAAGFVLLAVDEDAGGVHALGLPDAHYLGFVKPQVADGKFEAIAASGFGPAASDAGFVLLGDEEAPGWRLLRWDQVAAGLRLPVPSMADPRRVAVPSLPVVEPSVETQPVDDFGDAADDPAIWIHPSEPAKSLIIGAQKKRGIEVYDLAGRRLQVLADGRINNVDLRQGVRLGGRSLDIVAGSNRTHQSLSLYAMDAATGRLSDIAAGRIPTGMRDPYGLCMYVSARDGAAYVFINDSDRGAFRQWRLEDQGGKVGARLVREFVVGTQSEGCAADDETGALYVAEEDVGLWRYEAEPDGGETRRRIDATNAHGGRLRADVEGVAIFRGRGGAGYLVVSNQGADNYAVYRREGDNAFVGLFSVGANDELGIDGASETDGLEVTSTPLGPAFPHGLLVVQDGRNLTPAERQNYKLVPWERVAEALRLQ